MWQEYRTMLEVSPEELDEWLAHGWRRFGPSYYRPVCAHCAECVSLRIPVRTFHPTKSQRRAARKCAHLRLEVGAPKVDSQRLALYESWHAMRENSRGWEPAEIDEKGYRAFFAFRHSCAREFAYYDGERLVAIGLVDETPRALSSVYFYFDPDAAKLSLGTASVLFEIDYARKNGRDFLYLGYRVAGCASLKYKEHFGPHELLIGRPELHEAPVWIPQVSQTAQRVETQSAR